jgi:hypothetical protein
VEVLYLGLPHIHKLSISTKLKMTNLNKIYHKGRFRSGEWAKHLRPFLKRLGNKKFRKTAVNLEEYDLVMFRKAKKKLKKRIRVKITISLFGDKKYSYYKNYRTMKDLNNAVKRPNVIRYSIGEEATVEGVNPKLGNDKS